MKEHISSGSVMFIERTPILLLSPA